MTYVAGTPVSGTTPTPTLTVPVGVTTAFTGLIVFATATGTDWDPVPAKAGATFVLLDDRAATNLRVTIWSVTGVVAGDVITTSATINSGCTIWHAYQDQYTYDVASLAPAIRGGSSAVSVSGSVSPATGQPVVLVAVERTTATPTTVSSVVSSGGETITQRLFSEETAVVSSTYIGDFLASSAGARTATITYNTAAANGYAAVLTGTLIVIPPAPTVGPHHRYFKNYDYAQLDLVADQRGFIVGQSRVGITRLRATLGAFTSIKGGFTSITTAASVRVVDGAFLEPDLSSLTLTTRAQSAFLTYDSTEVTLTYAGGTVFTGYIGESTLNSEIGPDNTEEFTVQLLARGYETIRLNQPALATAASKFSVGGGPSSAPVIQWSQGKARKRAADITGLTIIAEDDVADVQLEEFLAVQNDVSGTQGELLAELAIRTGLLVDQRSASSVAFRSYQGAPLWQLEDYHLVSGYGIAVDRETASAAVLTRLEDNTFIRAWRAGRGAVVASQTISLFYVSTEWDPSTWAAYIPLQGTAKLYLTGATVPRDDTLLPPDRLPIEARFRHAGVTYRAAITALSHTITPERWMMSVTGQPVHLITRVGDLAPTAPAHVKGSLAGTTATLTWTAEAAATTTTTGTSSTFVVATADAANIDVGDDLRWYTAAGTLKEDTIFRVSAKAAPSGGNVSMTITPAITATQIVGDLLRFNDYGVTPDGGWQVWYQQGIPSDNRFISPNSAFSMSVTVFTTAATITGLVSGQTYRFTVYALSTVPGVHSAPSDYVQIAVP